MTGRIGATKEEGLFAALVKEDGSIDQGMRFGLHPPLNSKAHRQTQKKGELVMRDNLKCIYIYMCVFIVENAEIITKTALFKVQTRS